MPLKFNELLPPLFQGPLIGDDAHLHSFFNEFGIVSLSEKMPEYEYETNIILVNAGQRQSISKKGRSL